MAGVFCNMCGHRNSAGSRFCSSCGAQLSASVDDRTESFDAVGTDTESPAGAADGESGLVVTGGHRAGTRFDLRGELVTAGRHPESDIFLDDITVSRRHVELVHSETGWEVVDVGSLNGTYLNGARVERSPLDNGDELQIGKFKLLFVQRVG